jgi:hypothetical protein
MSFTFLSSLAAFIDLMRAQILLRGRSFVARDDLLDVLGAVTIDTFERTFRERMTRVTTYVIGGSVC